MATSPSAAHKGRAAYFEVSVVLGDDVLGARLVLAVPHVDVQLPLLQRQMRGAEAAAPPPHNGPRSGDAGQ